MLCPKCNGVMACGDWYHGTPGEGEISVRARKHICLNEKCRTQVIDRQVQLQPTIEYICFDFKVDP